MKLSKHERMKMALEKYNIESNDKGFLWALAHDKIEAMKLFLENGFDPNAIMKNGKTPLCYASMYGYYDIVDLLIKHGANVNLEANFTPLWMATINNEIEIVELLLKHEAKNWIHPPTKTSVLDMAIEKRNCEIIKLLKNNSQTTK